MKKAIASLLIVAMVSGCATSSKNIAASYTSPVQYQSYDCAQLGAEAQRIHVRVTELGGRLDTAAKNDKLLMAAGLLLVWPALFALGGTKAQEAEYARLQGEYNALNQQAIERKCQFEVTKAE